MTIGDSVTSIGDSTFSSAGLKSVNVDFVTNIGFKHFQIESLKWS